MTRPSPRKVGKALPPIYVVVMASGEIDWLTPTLIRKDAQKDAWEFPGDRVVKYVPSLPRKAGARRGR